jgi:hypothetical protein
MCLPGGGSTSLTGVVGPLIVTDLSAGHAPIENPSAEQLAGAVDAMGSCGIEFVILEEGEEFLQAAGSGRDGYALQWSTGDPATMRTAAPAADLATVRSALSAFRSRDRTFEEMVVWAPLDLGSSGPARPTRDAGGGLFARLLGKGRHR